MPRRNTAQRGPTVTATTPTTNPTAYASIPDDRYCAHIWLDGGPSFLGRTFCSVHHEMNFQEKATVH